MTQGEKEKEAHKKKIESSIKTLTEAREKLERRVGDNERKLREK